MGDGLVGFGRVTYNEPLSNHTSLKIGGPAKFFVKLNSLDKLPQLIEYSRCEQLPIVVLGNGTNVLFADKGFAGIVLQLPQGVLQSSVNTASAPRELLISAGYPLGKLVSSCRALNWGGLEFLAGIPGTVGGAVVTNAGAHGGEIGEYITKVEVLKLSTGQGSILTSSECDFAYRSSIFAKNSSEMIITKVHLTLPIKAFDQEIMMSNLKWRNKTQPVLKPNAGSIFKNPPGDFAGRLIEKYVGKGYQIGQAAISQEHANIFVNLGDASSSDFKKLIAHVKQVVYDGTGVLLDEEIVVY